MSALVAVLIADPQVGLDPAVVSAVEEATGGAPRWLDDKDAAEFVLHDEPSWDDQLRPLLGSARIDLAIVPAANRRKRLLIADMDSTIIEQECIDELADEVGKRDEVSAITERAMRGEIDFADALRERVATLRGLPTTAVDRVLLERIHIRAGALELVRTMRANGAHTMLISGGFTHFTRAIATEVGFDENRANTLNVAADAFDGSVAEPILGREAKLIALNEATAAYGITTDDALAVGDGANDLAMIETAGLGVALHAKPAVAARADVSIRYGDLTSLLYLQGYTSDKFVRS